MARPRKNPSIAPTNIRILDAAESAFGARGYLGTSLDEIAVIVGIRSPSLLYHFSSKAMLYEAVTHRLFDDLRESLIPVMATTEGYADRVGGLMEAFLKFVEAREAFAPIVLREVINGEGPARDILSTQIPFIIDEVIAWIEVAGKGLRPEGVPLRAALMSLCSDALIQASSGTLRAPLWGPESKTMVLFNRLMLK